jgi:hypothetical protein
MIDEAIRNTHPNAVTILDDKAYDKAGKLLAIDKNLVNAELVRLEAAQAATQYQRDRAVEYAKLNQFELRFDDMMNGTTLWKDAILAIKAKYPKPKVKLE